MAFEPFQVMERDELPNLGEALLDLASLSAQMLAHMARWEGRSSPDAPPPEQVFRELLTETLAPVLESQPPEAVDAARRVLVECVERIESEILLVEPSGPPREQRRRSRLARRPL
jgi:hypothetical protein